MSNALSRRTFVMGTGTALAITPVLTAGPADPQTIVGPLLGHVDDRTAIVWARMPEAGAFSAEIIGGDEATNRQTATATADSDFTVRWRFDNLRPATTYRYRLVDAQRSGEEVAGTFRTAPAPDRPSQVSLAFGSCALEDEGSRAIWKRMRTEKVDGLVLTGDTPYIDRTDLETQRRRYLEFGSVPEFQELTREVPTWGTWDDHDFGKNDADGRLPGKENALRAFKEYRSLASYGDDTVGIYTSFRYGPVEVFLIDARWFANTAPSPVDAEKPTLLGDAQWKWLQQALKASTAPWKVLVTGIIWDAKRNGEKDHWETYAHERKAIFDFIREHKISGVVLFGGDIHVTRVLRYDAEKTVGYPLYQFISSPIHARVIPKLNDSHPDLLHSAVEPNTFLKLTADTTGEVPELTASFLNKDGKRLFDDIVLSLNDHTPRD